MEMQALLIFACLGLASLAGLAMRTWITSFVDQRMKTRFESELENLRSDLRQKEGKISSIQSYILSGRANRRSNLEAKRLEALENVWLSVLEYDKFTMAAKSMSVLKIDAVAARAENEPKLREMLTMMSGVKGDDWASHMPNNSVEKYRIFVSEGTWNVFSVYRHLMVYFFMRLQVLASGLRDVNEIWDETSLAGSLKKVMPHVSEYIDKYGVIGAAHLVAPLRELTLSKITHDVFENSSDLDDVKSSAEIIELIDSMDGQLREVGSPN